MKTKRKYAMQVSARKVSENMRARLAAGTELPIKRIVANKSGKELKRILIFVSKTTRERFIED